MTKREAKRIARKILARGVQPGSYHLDKKVWLYNYPASMGGFWCLWGVCEDGWLKYLIDGYTIAFYLED